MANAVETREREFHFTDADFERVRKLIYKHAGISLAPIKRDMVYSRLARRLRALGIASFGEYLAHLEANDDTERETFVNSLTTNLTSFFREAHHFDILLRHLHTVTHRPIRIWCSAASTGEEPYTLAMTACEAFDTLTPPVSIVASDIDTNVLAAAERGVYPMERVEKLSRERLRRFFLKGAGAQAGYARVRPELQRLLDFTRINLLDARLPLQGVFDVMFCRNVMIYFDHDTQQQLVSSLSPWLAPGGCLIVGHSESLVGIQHDLTQIHPGIYRRK